MKKYSIRKISPAGSGNALYPGKEQWDLAVELTDFCYPWQNNIPTTTVFKALYDENDLFLRFEVEDEHILISRLDSSKMGVVYSDRVEVFFRQNNTLDPYYCLEIDPEAKILDYKARHYRKFDYNWSWPQASLAARSQSNAAGYTIDLKISLASLKALGVLKENTLEAGLYRANCIKLSGNKAVDSEIEWISWIAPKTETPDFHVSSSFGVLELE